MSTTPPRSLPSSRSPNAESHADDASATPAWRYQVVLADGLVGVNRIVTMLRQRTCEVMWLRAELSTAVAGGGTDSVAVVVAITEHDAALLDHRLLRLPSVLTVQRSRVGTPARSA